MAGFLSPISILIQLFTNQGLILAGGKIETYQAGTSTPQTTYTESTLTIPNDNPIILDGAGRLPFEVWVAGGSATKIVLKDVDDVTLFTADNWPLINDTTEIFADLLDPLQGVDLVANAVKSYDVFTSLRAGTPPTLAAGQTKIVIVEGGASINDGLGGAFYWSASSSATDDGISIIKPNATSGAGRFIRISWTAARGIDDSGTSTQTLGWRDLPQNVQNTNYTFVLSDRGKSVYHTVGTNTWTIPVIGTGSGQVQFPQVAAINLVIGGGTVFLVPTENLIWYPTGGTGTRTLVGPSDSVIKHIDATAWNLVGVGIT